MVVLPLLSRRVANAKAKMENLEEASDLQVPDESLTGSSADASGKEQASGSGSHSEDRNR
jgi:hypothetical protein